MIFELSLKDKGVDYTAGTSSVTKYVINTADPPDKSFGAGRVFYVEARGISLAVLGMDMPNGAILGSPAAVGVVSIGAEEAAL